MLGLPGIANAVSLTYSDSTAYALSGVSVTYNTSVSWISFTLNNGGSAGLLNGSHNMSDPGPNLSPTGSDTATLDKFYAWCLEPTEFNFANTYSLVNLTKAPVKGTDGVATTTMDVARGVVMETLVGWVNPTLGALPNNTAEQKKTLDAFQLALWEIANEGIGNSLNVDSGTFDISNYVTAGTDSAISGAKALANIWLANIADGTWTRKYLPLAAIIYDGRQDLLVRTEVPLPAAGWLFGSALAGTFALARRRRKAQQA